MSARMWRREIAVICTWLLPMVFADVLPADEAEPKGRQIIVISDLHMGLGKVQVEGAERWHKKEDFRWPNALSGFLAHIEQEAPAGIDLVIAGDFLELWQPPEGVSCKGPGEGAVPVDPDSTDHASLRNPRDYGCTVGEMEQITTQVVDAHADELGKLGRFATGGNCVHVVAGNHDAALVLPSVWKIVEEKMRRPKGPEPGDGKLGLGEICLRLASDLWVSGDDFSTDTLVAVEHGHMIGKDANSYSNWPKITRKFKTPDDKEETYLERPWGESFVQAIFNQEEETLPLIDNLSPKSAGLLPRFRDRGVHSVKDVAKFLRFNLVGTSRRQVWQLLGPEDAPEEWTDDELKTGRGLGYRLFARSMPPDDPLRAALESESEDTQALRQELGALVPELSDEEVAVLCDLIALDGQADGCRDRTAGAGLYKLFHTRKSILTPHVRALRKGQRDPDAPALRGRKKRLEGFAYGHTHKFEVPWEAETREGKIIRVVNSGAFQRLIDGKQIKAIVRKKNEENPDAKIGVIDLLRDEQWEEFVGACYTFVRITENGRDLDVELRAWLMDEKEEMGREDDPCTAACPKVGAGCRKDGKGR